MRATIARLARLCVTTATFGLIGACGALPKDPERTEALVRETGTIRLGWVTGAPSEPDALEVLRQVEQVTGAHAERIGGDSEALLNELEDGKIDVVYGRFAQDSPWATKVHLGSALGWRTPPPKHVHAPRFAFRSGENGWIMRFERITKR